MLRFDRGFAVVEEEEDAYIADLEKRLGVRNDLKGRDRYGIEFEQDGLLGEQ